MSPVRGMIFIAPDEVRGSISERQIGPQELFIGLIILWPALMNDVRLRSFVIGSTRGVVMLHVRECGPENVKIDARFPVARSHAALLRPRTLSGAINMWPLQGKVVRALALVGVLHQQTLHVQAWDIVGCYDN